VIREEKCMHVCLPGPLEFSPSKVFCESEALKVGIRNFSIRLVDVVESVI
jgi:hypothetical protein